MASLNVQIESTKYGAFTSYGKGQVSTLKPGITNQYNKDIYNQISQYQQREIPYFDDKSRYSSIYSGSMIKPISQDNFNEETKDKQFKLDLNNYQYVHEPNAAEIINNGNKKNEESIRCK